MANLQKFPVLFLREQRCCHVTYWDKWELKMVEARTSQEAMGKAKQLTEYKWADDIRVISPDGEEILHKIPS